MTERGDVRKFEPRVQDYFAVAMGHNADLTGQVAEATIAKFCGGCDALQDDGVCRVAGARDQARYAAREWCGWASVNGVRGEMTSEGFKGESPTPQE